MARGPYTETVFADVGKHYVTLFVVAQAGQGPAQLLEPAKCSGWHWFRWPDMPQPLFEPLESLRASGFVPQPDAVS